MAHHDDKRQERTGNKVGHFPDILPSFIWTVRKFHEIVVTDWENLKQSLIFHRFLRYIATK